MSVFERIKKNLPIELSNGEWIYPRSAKEYYSAYTEDRMMMFEVQCKEGQI